jgi:hypothetical protein
MALPSPNIKWQKQGKLNKLFATLSVVSATLAHFRHFKLQTYYGQLYLGEKVTKLSILIIIAIMGVIVLLRKRIAGAVANNKNLRDAPIGNVTKNLTDITAKGIDWLNEQWGQSKEKSKNGKTTEVIACPECGQRLRIPKDVNLTIECPRTKCKAVFDYIEEEE